MLVATYPTKKAPGSAAMGGGQGSSGETVMRLGTEYKIIVGHPRNRPRQHTLICQHVANWFPHGFTAWQASGYWKGQPEPCTVILIATDDVLKMLTMQRCATSLAKAFDQECVYLSGPDGARLVYANATA